jgi:hypothetical protein
MEHVVKVGIFEERMSFNVFCVILTRPKSPGWVACEQLLVNNIT